jgi:hypothetical protein
VLEYVEIDMLADITQYGNSVSMLEKNDVGGAYELLASALSDARMRYPEAVNLHMFLLSRSGMLLKLMGQSQRFVGAL